MWITLEEQALEQTALALAFFEQPDFSGLPPGYSIARVFGNLFAYLRFKRESLESLQSSIKHYSQGRVKIALTDPDDFKFHPMGPAAYLLLTGPQGQAQRIIIGPYNTPVIFDHD